MCKKRKRIERGRKRGKRSKTRTVRHEVSVTPVELVERDALEGVLATLEYCCRVLRRLLGRGE